MLSNFRKFFCFRKILFPGFYPAFLKTDYINSLCHYVQPPATPLPSPRTPSWITSAATTTTPRGSCRTSPVPSTRETRPGHARQGTTYRKNGEEAKIIGTKMFFPFRCLSADQSFVYSGVQNSAGESPKDVLVHLWPVV